MFQSLKPTLISMRDTFVALLPTLQNIGQFFVNHAGTILKVAAAFYAITAAVAAYNYVLRAYSVISKVITALTVVWRNAQLALNLAMMINPIGLVVLAVVALVAIFVVAWKKSETFRNIIIGTWNAIKKAASAVWGFIKNLLSNVWDWIKSPGKAVFESFKNVVTTVWNAIKTATSAVWNAIKTAVTLYFKLIKTAITLYFNAYKTVITTAWTVIKTVTTTVWNAIKSAVSAVYNFLKTGIQNAFNAYKTIITNVWNAVKNGTVNAWNGIKSAVQSAVNKVVEFVRGIKDRIVSFFSNAGQWLVSAGREHHPRSMERYPGYRRLDFRQGEWIHQVGTTRAGRGALVTNSPSKVFAEIGKYTVLGLADGLGDRSALKRVRNASGAMIGEIGRGATIAGNVRVRSDFTALGTASAQQQTGGNTYTINVQATPGTNRYALAKEVVTLIQDYEASAGTSWRRT